MKRLSELPPHDLELLSAYLDEGLRPHQKERLVARLEREPDLRWALGELRRTVSIVRSLPEVRPPKSYTLTPESAGIRMRAPAYPLLQFATALATLAFVAVVGLDALTSRTGHVAFAPAVQEQAERLAAPSMEEATEAAQSEAMPAVGAAEAEMPAQAVGEMAVGSPAPQATLEVEGDRYAFPAAGASEALPTDLPEDTGEEQTLIPSDMPCIECGGGGPEVGEPPSIALAPPEATPAPTTLSTEGPVAKVGESPDLADQAGVPSAFSTPPAEQRAGLPPVRLIEIGLGLAALTMAGLTLWVRRRG